MKKVSIIFGTRPEAIKFAPLIESFKQYSDIQVSICVTGQHKEMLDPILTAFSIVPDVNLNVMTHNQTLSGLTARLLTSIDEYLVAQKPNLVFGLGDTTTAFVSSLASFYHKIPFAHIEAGMRTYNLAAPWPEEGNRVLMTRLSRLHFAPSTYAYKALITEGVPESTIFHTGNTVIDALFYMRDRLHLHENEIRAVIPPAVFNTTGKVILITGHRRESFDGGLERVARAVGALAHRFPDTHFVYPVHLNPIVQNAISSVLGPLSQENVHLIPPLSYVPFVWLMQRSFAVITDSGGVQEEAPSFGKPVLVTREVTERREGIDQGNAVLVGTDTERIVKTTSRLLTDQGFYDSMSRAGNPYGSGDAAIKITHAVRGFLAA